MRKGENILFCRGGFLPFKAFTVVGQLIRVVQKFPRWSPFSQGSGGGGGGLVWWVVGGVIVMLVGGY